MLAKLLALLAVLCFALPAQAVDYVIIPKGDERPVELRNGTEPVPGVDCPANSQVKVFAPLMDEKNKPDIDYRNYILVTGGLRRVPPAPPSDAKQGADLATFRADVAASGAVSDAEFNQILRASYIVDPTVRAQKMKDALAAPLNSAKTQALLDIATKAGVSVAK